ncbi:GNAT family N-acetyltransferase [Candidatus Woesearchaeota archaeon]|nr:GNAT family N-acetyltransferase [Candidatus Woesearchaeota archaeon]
MGKTIKSKNFILRPYKKGDEYSLIKNINDKDVSKYTHRIPYPYKLKDAKQWIARCKNLAKKKNKTEINFAIDIEGVIGGISLMGIQPHKAEIGCWLGKKYWRKGIATEAVEIITHFGFKQLKLKRIYAYVYPKNKSSVRVLEKNKYKREGLMRKYQLKDGKLLDTILYAKIK